MAARVEPLERLDTATFAVTGGACPQLPCRILGAIAQQGRVVDAIEAVRSGDRLHIRIRLSDIDPHRAAVLAEKMRMLVQVETLDVVLGERASPPPA